MSATEFTAKMSAALVAYSEFRNKSAAYREAYDCKGMLPRTVHREAIRLFNHPLMSQAVDNMRAIAAKESVVNSAWVLERARRLADFDINKFIVVDELGNAVYDFSTASDDDWYCISEYTVDVVMKGKGNDTYPVERVKIKAESKIRALELCGKHVDVQAFKDNAEITGTVFNVTMSPEEYKKVREETIGSDDC
jgi:phage terminase small subunit